MIVNSAGRNDPGIRDQVEIIRPECVFPRQIQGDLENHPCSGVAAFMEQVIHQPGVAAHGDALPGGIEIGFGGHRVLVVAQVITDIGEHFHKGDAQIRHVPFLPVRHDKGQAVKDEPAEAGVVLG